jgi:hypothetical protein
MGHIGHRLVAVYRDAGPRGHRSSYHPERERCKGAAKVPLRAIDAGFRASPFGLGRLGDHRAALRRGLSVRHGRPARATVPHPSPSH